MKKKLDWLLEAFLWLYGVFMYSLALPLFLGVSVVFIAPLTYWLLDHVLVYVLVSVIVGLYLKKWHGRSHAKEFDATASQL